MEPTPRPLSLDANGLRHHVLEWPGPPERTVLLLHGYLDCAASFASFSALLAARGYRVVAPDLRGHGDTGWVGAGGYYHFPDYLADVASLVPLLLPDGASPLAVLGHSMGGAVATMYAGALPERLRALILAEGLGAPPMPPEVAPERLRRWLGGLARTSHRTRRRMVDLAEVRERLNVTHGGAVPPEVLARVAPLLSMPHPSGEGLAWRFDPLHQTTSPLRFDREGFAVLAQSVAVPTLLLDGGSSGLHFPDDAERRAWFSRASAVSLEGAGHMMHWTQPETFASAVAAFLEAALR